ncbi:sulfatase family protein [Pelagicoccus mobilis]|uniref:Sulfatase-like hydrolase/transferase n=1 Tax=Pelagicoccus mobilis TaxID=415221 RepID=A0A934RZ12_9BACT|nr:sulfatase-like hydrolase/transferase [Pelagicoccus mobilis]MBK1879347.1 sulfatase-like hydrolase/transferase [Pelagicoccus mobilis]
MKNSSSPNILLIFTDQLRADCIAELGNSKIKTPNIDRLVREGTTFNRCYTPSPVCVPARHSLTSGLPPHVTGCVDNVDIEPGDQSFMEKLVEQGYETHGVGKMHFSKELGDWGYTSRDTSEELEQDADRDDYRDYLKANGYNHVQDPHGLRSEFYYVPQPSQLPEHLHNTHWVADKSIQFLENRDTSKPFFLWSSFIKPHPPFESPNPWGRLYRMHEMDEPILPEGSEQHICFWNKLQNRYKVRDGGSYDRNMARMIKAAYYATVSFIDYNVGRILDSLGSEIDNTLILFSADHGEMLGDFGCYGKRTMLDPSAKVPMIARLPGAFPEGERCSLPTTLLDLYPTFLDFAASGAERPSREGISLSEAIDEKKDDRIVFSQYSQNRLGLYMATNRQYKYIYSAPDNREFLYDLSKDPLELYNCFGDEAHQSAGQALKQACLERFRADDYNKAISGDDWKRFPAMAPPAANSDDGMLFQDPTALDDQISQLGEYARPMEIKNSDCFRVFERLVKESLS